MNNIRVTLIAITVISVIVGMSWLGWTLKRTINYRWYYQDSVQSDIQKEIKPLKDRIKNLEWRLSNLETNR